MTMTINGALPAQTITQLINQDYIIGASEKNVSPASLDLTLADEMYTIRGLILPKVGETIRDLLPLMEAKKADLHNPVACGQLYLVRLTETLDLPQQVYGYCNPKSSTGRLDMHVRVLADGVPRYDSVTPKGFKGELWLAIAAQSFSVQLHAGTSLTQLRLFTGDSRFSELELELALENGLVWHPKEDKKLTYTDLVTNDKDGAVVLTAQVEEGVCGYQCIATPDQVIDVHNIAHYPAADFFEPMYMDEGVLRLKRDKFYILSAAERVKIPPYLASEMVPMDERSGDFRSHYAGFLDPGWGWGLDGEGKGRPFTLEVRPFEDLVVRAGQPIAKIKFEKMIEEPIFHYDTKASNYLTQSGPKLGKQFIH
jgi:dCTP deaminase